MNHSNQEQIPEVSGILIPSQIKPHEQERCQTGFTLIEVLVASTILMLSIGVLLQLFSSGLDRNQRAGEQAHLLTSQRVIMHVLDGVNPAERTQGKGMAEGLAFSWQAVVQEPFRPVRDVQFGNRELALFAVTVEVETARGKHHRFVYTRTGWRATQ